MTDPQSLGDDLKRLEEIVRKLEDDDLALESALELFEEGVQRLKTAQDRLAAAETRVMQVLQEFTEDGTPKVVPLDG
ncbi:MAG: exodeoxyribonuclease VII small subunit [Gemmatimonadales bacterium]|jgi:exodeoxyribonuclease VII small subunit|nr:exodeoxyribonuclease VII small subunit [Gemmatimonadales bacterium]MDZ4390137.1 exodeoxyribonuclease VII small subunit [Gemmatimonadales bacterium]PKL94136.1 MAG: exodeoxyribonuclease VII small subunit [Gemmatimonadetes bacterium HGW-Gemmatimonadetes-1]